MASAEPRDRICGDLRALERAVYASVGGPANMGRPADELLIWEFEGIVSRVREHAIEAVSTVGLGATYGDLLGAVELQMATIGCAAEPLPLMSDDFLADL